MTVKQRVKKLEAAAGLTTVFKYLCVKWIEPDPEGYKIQPFTMANGGTGADPFCLATWEEVEAFEARPDVDLFMFVIERQDQKKTECEK